MRAIRTSYALVGILAWVTAQCATAGRDQYGTYYSPLAQINAGNVADLGFAWEFKTGTYRGLEATPVVIDGVMYTSGGFGVVYALNATSGALLWQFNPHSDGQSARYSGAVDVANRGVAVWQGKVYVTALDCRMFALDAHTGSKIWETNTRESTNYACTGAPQVAGRVIVMGNGGGDFGHGGVRGYVSGYDLDTGEMQWRFYTVPKIGETNPSPEMTAAAASWNSSGDANFGGGTVWDAMAYDPDLDLLYFGTGNAAPYIAQRRVNGRDMDRLYAASIIALHASSGRMAWYYQTTPGDIWDFDANARPVLADLKIGGKIRKTLIQANKNGYFYVIDRASGTPLSAKAFAYINWSTGMDANFRPIVSAKADYSATPRMIIPGNQGAHSWSPMSYSLQTGLVYIPVLHAPIIMINIARNPGASVKYVEDTTGPAAVVPDKDFNPADIEPLFGTLPTFPKADPYGKPLVRAALIAWDPVRQRRVWEQQTSQDYLVLDGGVLSTAGNLVFAGREDGRFMAYAADSGKTLKTIDTGTATMAAPMTYEVDGTQYVAVMQGHGGSFMNGVAGTPTLNYLNEGRILVMKLGGAEQIPKPALKPVEPRREPPPQQGTPQQVAAGRTLFNTWCAECHTLGVASVTPDLTRLNRGIVSGEVFKAIILKGALVPLGMARFDDVLTEADADTLHAFLVDRSWEEYNQEQKRVLQSPH